MYLCYARLQLIFHTANNLLKRVKKSYMTQFVKSLEPISTYQ